MKLRRCYRVSNTVHSPAGVQVEFLTDTHEGLAVFLDWETGGRQLMKLMQDNDGEVAVTFSRVPKVTGTCEVIKRDS